VKNLPIVKIAEWLDRVLEVSAFDDVSNNGLQLANESGETPAVAFAVDASVESVKRAAEAGAKLLVVHHGFSWGGGIRRLTGGIYNVVKSAMDADLAIYACHLPLDASKVCGNNWEIARALELTGTKKAFSYHGNVIGLTGKLKDVKKIAELFPQLSEELKSVQKGRAIKLGVCSGGAGDFAEAAQKLGCDLYLTGEASWGDVVGAKNVGIKMLCAGHYETEVFGVRALAKMMSAEIKIKTIDIT
jgi:dinuclear metal center YbgI/SA1388 family protein